MLRLPARHPRPWRRPFAHLRVTTQQQDDLPEEEEEEEEVVVVVGVEVVAAGVEDQQAVQCDPAQNWHAFWERHIVRASKPRSKS